jgi:tRNA pseudouridine55 synthase
MDGILLVDKPEGVTSAQVVRVVKKRLHGCKVGHLGTLDPSASGLLPLCIGRGTKIAQFLAPVQKGYTGVIKLGVETDTLDATGRVVRTAPVPLLGEKELVELERRFIGEQTQLPPVYSAIKKAGVPLYKLARRGIEVEREPRPVMILSLSLQLCSSDEIAFDLLCSKGTYVRSLAADLGQALGCGAHLLRLRRVAFVPFTIAQAVPFSDLPIPLPSKPPFFLSSRQALCCYREVKVAVGMAGKLRQGQQRILDQLNLCGREGEIVHLLTEEGESVALAQQEREQWRLVRVL